MLGLSRLSRVPEIISCYSAHFAISLKEIFQSFPPNIMAYDGFIRYLGGPTSPKIDYKKLVVLPALLRVWGCVLRQWTNVVGQTHLWNIYFGAVSCDRLYVQPFSLSFFRKIRQENFGTELRNLSRALTETTYLSGSTTERPESSSSSGEGEKWLIRTLNTQDTTV